MHVQPEVLPPVQASWWPWVLTQRVWSSGFVWGTSVWIYIRETCSHRILLLPTLSC